MGERRYERALVWFRRDLRAYDHAALFHAMKDSHAVFCVFVFDTDILQQLPRYDRRVEFIWDSVSELCATLERMGGGLTVLYGRMRDELPKLALALRVQAVYTNHDYEPDAVERDLAVERALLERGIALHTFKDQVVFEKGEVLTRRGLPFGVYTAYRNAWLQRLTSFYTTAYPVEKYATSLARPASKRMPTLEEVGFKRGNLRQLRLRTGSTGGRAWFRDFLSRMDQYQERRNYPALRGPSYLSVHLRFGTVSIRELVAAAVSRGGPGSTTWLSELIWREFYFMILHHHPRVVSHAFRPQLDGIQFPNREDWFQAWCEGRTGYPLVDAAMRQINGTGYMHNRLRMITASFLVKDLRVDWRWGERYFARHLNDYDLAANNGGWQWAASTGCDSQPYFRIFNPVTQSEKFDAEGKFIRQYVPELKKVPTSHIHAPWGMSASEQRECGVLLGRDYPLPIVDHAEARKEVLKLYGKARNAG